MHRNNQNQYPLSPAKTFENAPSNAQMPPMFVLPTSAQPLPEDATVEMQVTAQENLTKPKTKKEDDNVGPTRKKRKKKRQKDTLYNPRVYKGINNSKDGGLSLRHPEREKKQTVLAKRSPFAKILRKKDGKSAQILTPKTEAKVSAHLYEGFAKAPFFSPVIKINRWENNIPVEVETSTGPKYLVKDYGSFLVYDETPPIPSPQKVKLPSVSEELKAELAELTEELPIQPNASSTKYQEVLITPELLQKSQREIARNNGRRSQSQNSVMVKEDESEKKGSATQYAEEIAKVFGIVLGNCEWLHLIAHFILASKSQNVKNLGGGTYDANTDMMLFEYQHKKISKDYPKGYLLQVTANFLEGTQQLRAINYVIITDHYTLKFKFDCTTQVPPHIANLDFVNTYLETVNKLRDGALASPLPNAPKFMTMFSPSQQSQSNNANGQTDMVVKKLDMDVAGDGMKQSTNPF